MGRRGAATRAHRRRRLQAVHLPLLFLKRLSDVYDEERAGALQTYAGDEELADLPENHRFAIPDGAHWQDIRETTQDVGQAILGAMRRIEAANPNTLRGVFGEGDGSPAALPRAANHEASLGVATIGAITHTSADVDRRAAARASSWSSRR